MDMERSDLYWDGLSHEELIGTYWTHEQYDYRKHQLIWQPERSLYLIVNLELSEVTFQGYWDDVINELKQGWVVIFR